MEYLSNLDRQAFLLINSSTAHPLVILLATILSGIGWSRYVWFLAALFVMYKLRGRQQVVLLLIAVTIASYFMSLVVFKPLFGRLRPQHEVPSTVIYNTESVDYYAFPSVHSTASFAVAYILAYAYPSLGLYFYSGAFLVALSRVYLGVHYPSDVIAGAGLGILIAYGARRLITGYAKRKMGKRR